MKFLIPIMLFISISAQADCVNSCQVKYDAVIDGCTNAKNFCIKNPRKAEFCYEFFYKCTQKANDELASCKQLCSK